MEVAGLERDSSMAPMAHDAENPKTMKFINSSSCKDHAGAAADMKNEVPNLAADRTTKRSSMEANYLNHSSISSSSSIHDQDQVLKSAKAKMGKIREENERLKTLLAKITIDYESLQAHLSNLADDHDRPNNKSVPQAGGGDPDGGGGHDEPEQLLCDLTLGRSSSRSPPGFLATADHRLSVDDGLKKKYEGQERGLKLGLDSSKFEVEPADQNNIIERRGPNYNSSSSTASGTSAARDYYITKRSSCEESKEPERLSPPNTSSTKSLVIGNKTSSATGSAGEDHESDVSLLQPPLKKTRVSIRARCDAPTINDGCQWRKYGQKISKGNPCPRAYYRCTVSPTCPVRKQVQRCPEDMSILITTYEGNHNHPLPISATAIASATSAAASMLQSGSSSTTATTANATAGCFHPPTQGAAATLSAGLHGLNFAFSNDSPPGKLYFPNPTTNINSHPTITLDLTTAPNIGTATNWPLGTNASAAAAGYYSLVNPTRDFITSYYGYNPSSTSGTCLNFSSPPSSSSYQLQNATPANWGTRCLNFGSMTSTSSAGAGRYDSTSNNMIMSSGGVQQHPKQEGSNPSIPHIVNNQQQSSMDETISMATRAIASNPKFQSVLAAAISSYVGNKGGNAATASGTAVSRQDSGNDHQTSVEDRGHDRS